MLGYYNRPDRTNEVMDKEGWFHTGDIGVIEEGKYPEDHRQEKRNVQDLWGKIHCSSGY